MVTVAMANSNPTHHQKCGRRGPLRETNETTPSRMIRATASNARGLSAITTRRRRPQETTAGPESQTSDMMTGTSRNAFRRLVQATLKLWRICGLELGVTFKILNRARTSFLSGQAQERANSWAALGSQLGSQTEQRGARKNNHGNQTKCLSDSSNSIRGEQTNQS